ncbi:5' nucleotidase, NT5C type [Kineococcus arenarius]|uniref:5' nucleotidase, NT5C type n=1 Tax=Kineococcus sp. SYSU DK007 TaxID=3383128 RepID=UPI003D7CC0BC
MSTRTPSGAAVVHHLGRGPLVLVLVDQDQTLADFGDGFDRRFSATHPDAPLAPRAQADSYWIEDSYPEHWHERIRAVPAQEGFFRELRPLPGARDALEAMLDAGHDVRICTAPVRAYRHCVREKYEWVEEHLGRHWTERVIVTRDKTLVAGDVLVDDKPEVVGTFAAPSWTHVYYRTGYNEHLPGAHLDWSSWSEVLDAVEAERAGRGTLLLPRLTDARTPASTHRSAPAGTQARERPRPARMLVGADLVAVSTSVRGGT